MSHIPSRRRATATTGTSEPGRRALATQAIAALDDPPVIRDRARRFALSVDPTRLALLPCIRAAEPISVSDLATAAA